MNNLGKPIPYARRDIAYSTARSFGVEHDAAFSLIEAMANDLERDHPHEALGRAMQDVDFTGAYRLMAHLLVDEPALNERGVTQ